MRKCQNIDTLLIEFYENIMVNIFLQINMLMIQST